jgi:hypothetical protein
MKSVKKTVYLRTIVHIVWGSNEIQPYEDFPAVDGTRIEIDLKHLDSAEDFELFNMLL